MGACGSSPVINEVALEGQAPQGRRGPGQELLRDDGTTQAGSPVPDPLPTGPYARLRGGSRGCKIADASERGISLRQLQHVFTCALEKCKEGQWTDASGHPLTAVNITIRDILYRFVQPATDNGAVALVELISDRPQRPDWFVSHWYVGKGWGREGRIVFGRRRWRAGEVSRCYATRRGARVRESAEEAAEERGRRRRRRCEGGGGSCGVRMARHDGGNGRSMNASIRPPLALHRFAPPVLRACAAGIACVCRRSLTLRSAACARGSLRGSARVRAPAPASLCASAPLSRCASVPLPLYAQVG
jgi:hypothetical protein